MRIVNFWYQLVGILILGLAMAQVVQAATCNQYKAQVNQALYAKNLPKLSEFLGILKRLPDCSDAYLDGIKREMSNLAAVRADKMVRRGQLQKAKTWLQYKYAPVNVWMTQTGGILLPKTNNTALINDSNNEIWILELARIEFISALFRKYRAHYHQR